MEHTTCKKSVHITHYKPQCTCHLARSAMSRGQTHELQRRSHLKLRHRLRETEGACARSQTADVCSVGGALV